MHIGMTMLNVSGKMGGGANYALTLLREWEKINVNYKIYTSIEYAEALYKNNIPFEKVQAIRIPPSRNGPDLLFKMLIYYEVIEKFMKKDKIDVTFQCDLFGSLLYRGKKSQPIISTVHGLGYWFFPTDFRTMGIYFHTLYRLMLLQSDLIIAVSNSTLADLVQIYHIQPSKLRLVYNAVDQDIYSPKPNASERVKDLFNISDPYILFAGSGNTRKNIQAIIKAVSILANKHPHMLVLAGVGKSPYIQKLISENGIDHRAILLDHIPNHDMPYLYSGADLFLFPSLYEGQSLALLEAMACGCPIVTSNFGSMLETVKDSAICVNSYDVRNIAEGLDRMLSDAELRYRLGSAAIERARLFSVNNQARNTLDVIQEAWDRASIYRNHLLDAY